MVGSDTFGAYILRNLAYVICLSVFTARMINLHCSEAKMHCQLLCWLFSWDWQSMARATQLGAFDHGHPVIRLIAANEYLK
jgi:hypothetical protein